MLFFFLNSFDFCGGSLAFCWPSFLHNMSPISKAMWSQHHFAKLYGWLNNGRGWTRSVRDSSDPKPRPLTTKFTSRLVKVTLKCGFFVRESSKIPETFRYTNSCPGMFKSHVSFVCCFVCLYSRWSKGDDFWYTQWMQTTALARYYKKQTRFKKTPCDYEHLHPQKLTWNLEMVISNRNLLFQGSIFRFHVWLIKSPRLQSFRPSSPMDLSFPKEDASVISLVMKTGNSAFLFYKRCGNTMFLGVTNAWTTWNVYCM